MEWQSGCLQANPGWVRLIFATDDDQAFEFYITGKTRRTWLHDPQEMRQLTVF